MPEPGVVLAITGASGAIYATRLLECLVRAEQDIHLVVSPSGKAVLKQELDLDVSAARPDPRVLLSKTRFADGEWVGAEDYDLQRVSAYSHTDFLTPIASGSFLTGGMVICPCSGTTMSAVAYGHGSNLIHRAADVHLKERRKLVLVPRETPLSSIQLDNMRRVSDAGAVVLPAMPGWYHGVASVQDLVDFVVARILDQLGLDNRLMLRWGSPAD